MSDNTETRPSPWCKPFLTAEQRAAAFFPEVGMQGDAGDLAEAFHCHAADAVHNSDVRENLRKAIMLLDCALPHFEIQARREAEAGAGLALRPITCQERLKAVRHMIRVIGPTVGYVE